MEFKNQELQIISQRVKRMGDTLYSYDEVFDIIQSDEDYTLEELCIYVFEVGDEFSIKQSCFDMTEYNDVTDFIDDISKNVVKTKSYKRPTNWEKKLYEHAKLNNFMHTFIIVSE